MSSYIIDVTYGTRKHQVYAEPVTLDDAQKLLIGAKERGYKDAKIVTRKEFYEARAAEQAGSPHSAGAPRRAA